MATIEITVKFEVEDEGYYTQAAAFRKWLAGEIAKRRGTTMQLVSMDVKGERRE